MLKTNGKPTYDESDAIRRRDDPYDALGVAVVKFALEELLFWLKDYYSIVGETNEGLTEVAKKRREHVISRSEGVKEVARASELSRVKRHIETLFKWMLYGNYSLFTNIEPDFVIKRYVKFAKDWAFVEGSKNRISYSKHRRTNAEKTYN